MPEQIWRPFPRQVDFLQLPDTIFEALYGGAAGGGKSDTLVLLPVARRFYTHSRFKGIIFRRTYAELEAEVIVRSHQWYPATGATYNSEKKRWTWPSGAIMQFGHCEHESDIRKYDSAEYNYMAFDELTSFTEFQYKYIAFTRCRSSVPELPSIVRAGTNPGNIGHSWVKDRFIDCGPPNVIFVDSKTRLKRIFIPSKVTDNPHIDPEYANRLRLLPEAEQRAKLDGEWNTFEGQVFDDFRVAHIEGEPAHAVHVIPPFKIPEWWPVVLAVDWGYAAMTYAIWGALSPQNRLFCFQEYGAKNKKIVDWCSDIRNLNNGINVTKTVLCRSAWQNRGEELLLADQFKKITGLTPELPDNSRVAGKNCVQEFLRWREKPNTKIVDESYDHERAMRILRNEGLERYKKYLDCFEPQEPETNLPKVQIFDNLEIIQNTLPLCIYDKKNSMTSKPAEDVREFDGDDPYDAFRYLCMAAQDMFDKTKSESKYRAQVDNAVQNLQKTNDWTAFHRTMEVVERQKPKAKPVKRFKW